jgi:hypothetical protein
MSHSPGAQADTVLGTQAATPHTLGTPLSAPASTLGAPPQTGVGAAHVPQSIMPPQPSGIVPQFLFSAEHLTGVHPHSAGVPPPPQVCGKVHPGQVMWPPQPSDTVSPHWPGVQSAGVNGTHALHGAGAPPSAGPHWSMPPHPSGIDPQVTPIWTQVTLVHPHTPAFAPPPHVSGNAQPGQCRTLSHPSEMTPHVLGGQAVKGTHAVAPHLFGAPGPPSAAPPPQYGVAPPHVFVQR